MKNKKSVLFLLILVAVGMLVLSVVTPRLRGDLGASGIVTWIWVPMRPEIWGTHRLYVGNTGGGTHENVVLFHNLLPGSRLVGGDPNCTVRYVTSGGAPSSAGAPGAISQVVCTVPDGLGPDDDYSFNLRVLAEPGSQTCGAWTEHIVHAWSSLYPLISLASPSAWRYTICDLSPSIFITTRSVTPTSDLVTHATVENYIGTDHNYVYFSMSIPYGFQPAPVASGGTDGRCQPDADGRHLICFLERLPLGRQTEIYNQLLPNPAEPLACGATVTIETHTWSELYYPFTSTRRIISRVVEC